MNRIKGIFGLGAAVAAALTLGACSQDETAGGDGALSPMELTATGLEPMVTPMTRATVDGDWSNVTKVAVKVDSEVKEYTVTLSADKKKATLTSPDPFYWPASGGVTVSAWPYNGADMTKPAVVVQSNQSGGGYAASDFIEAVAQSVTKDNNALEFTHRTAKICVKLTAADGSELTNATVSIAVGGQTVEKCLSASDGGHLALIAPTAAAAELTVKITADEKNYVYKHTAVKYDANSQYTFNLKVMNGEAVALSGCEITGWTDKLTVNDGEAEEVDFTVDDDGTYHVYTAKGLKAWADAVKESSDGNVSAILENDIEMPAVDDGESNWEPVSNSSGFCGTFDGNGKTITGLVVSTESNAGFIDNTRGNGGVKNLTLKDAKIKGTNNVGAVVARHNSRGKVENCRVTGTSVIDASGGDHAGGVVGSLNNSSTILACSVAKGCEVKGTEKQNLDVGGIVGYNKGGSVVLCYALCKLNGYKVGGICGKSVSSGSDGTASFSLCYSKCQYIIIGSGSGSGIVREKSGDPNLSNCCYSGANTAVGDAADGTAVTKVTDEQQWHSEAVSSILDGKESDGYKYQKTDNTAEPYVIVRKQQ